MKKNILLSAIGVGAIALSTMQTACSQNAEEKSGQTEAASITAFSGNGFPDLKDKVKQDTALDVGSVQWETNNSVPVKRQIEVGDHPNVVLEKFKMGQREQKVRFFVADDKRSQDLVSNSPQDELLKKDVDISKSENSKWSLYGMVVHAPTSVGLQKFSDNSMFNGLAVTPQLMICASEGLKNLKLAADKAPRVFQNWQIDMVNVFIKPVQHAAEAESKMAIDPKLNALNFQLSVWTRSGDCFLPTVEDIREALTIADQRIHE